jgi:hypothetical protein
MQICLHFMISGFHYHVNEVCTLLESYTALIGSLLPVFRDNLSVLSSRVKQSKKYSSWTACRLKMGPVGCPETLVTNYKSVLC